MKPTITDTVIELGFPPFFVIPKGQDMLHFARSRLPELAALPGVKTDTDQGEAKDSMPPELLSRPICSGGKSCPRNCQGQQCAIITLYAVLLYLRVLYVSDVEEGIAPSSLGLLYLRDSFLAPRMAITTLSTSGKKTFPITTELIHAIFTGKFHYVDDRSSSSPAVSARGICVYRAGVDDPTGPLDEIARFQVVRGYISYESRQYSALVDREHGIDGLRWQGELFGYAGHDGVAEVRVLVDDSVGTADLHVGYRVYHPQIHEHTQSSDILLESMITYLSAQPRNFQRNHECVDILAATAAQTYCGLQGLENTVLTLEPESFKYIQPILREYLNQRSGLIMISMRGSDRDTTRIYIGDTLLRFPHHLKTGFYRILSPTRCLFCAVQGWNALMYSTPILQQSEFARSHESGTIRVFGLPEKEITLRWRMKIGCMKIHETSP